MGFETADFFPLEASPSYVIGVKLRFCLPKKIIAINWVIRVGSMNVKRSTHVLRMPQMSNKGQSRLIKVMVERGGRVYN